MNAPGYEDCVISARDHLKLADRPDFSGLALKAICYALLSIGAAIKEASEMKKPDNQ